LNDWNTKPIRAAQPGQGGLRGAAIALRAAHPGLAVLVLSRSAAAFAPRGGAPGMGHERLLGPEPVVRLGELPAVALDREAGHDPDHPAQEVDHSPDVVEDGAQGSRPQVDHGEAGRPGGVSEPV
jgi:hypothetical protein